jgi:hypothetical protein
MSTMRFGDRGLGEVGAQEGDANPGEVGAAAIHEMEGFAAGLELGFVGVE